METPKTKIPLRVPSPVLAARCSKRQKRRVKQAEASTGMNETDFILTAVEEFFATHKTPAEQIAAVQAYRLKQAQT